MLVPRTRRRSPARAAAVVLAVVVAAVSTALLLLHLAGAAWYVVETPSMGQAAPVGTLVVSAPVRIESVRVGDVVTYTPPGGSSSTITHRVVAVRADGLRTRGDVNGAEDPWTLSDADVRGRAVALVPGAGWLLRAAPLLLGGLAAVVALGVLVRDRAARAALQALGCSAVVCATVLVFRPLVNAAVQSMQVGAAGTTVRLVGTGMLPVRVTAYGRSLDLTDGRAGLLRLPHGTAGRIELTTALHLEPWGWALFTAVCALPLLAVVLRCGSRGVAA